MKKLLKSGVFLLLSFVFLSYSFTTSTTYFGQTLASRMEFVYTHWEDMKSETDLDYDAITSWLPDQGIRGKYQIAKSILSIETMEGIIGHSVYLNDVHSEGMDYDSETDFGRYNPEFLVELKNMLGFILSIRLMVDNSQDFYDRYLKNYLRTYYLSHELAIRNKALMTDYVQAMAQYDETGEKPGWMIQTPFSRFATRLASQGYDEYEAFVCPGFWIRRSIDGTEDEFFELLELVIKTYDIEFLDK